MGDLPNSLFGWRWRCPVDWCAMNRVAFVVTFGGMYLAALVIVLAMIWFGTGPL
jgi:hypothetical protein